MSETSDLLGTPLTFEFEGRSYRVYSRPFEVEAKLERHLEERDLATVQRFFRNGLLSREEYREQMDAWRRGVTAGRWAFGSPDFAAYYGTPEGVRKACFLQLEYGNEGQISEGVIDRVWDDDAKWAELSEKIAAANADPLTRGRPRTTPTPS